MFVALLSLAYDILCWAVWSMGVLHNILPLWLEGAGALAAIFYATRLRKPSPEDVNAVFGSRPRCIAHRGAQLDAPENTIAAFKYCLESGVDFVELDVRSCADGLVVSHDAELSRLAGPGAPHVATSTRRQLADVDVSALHPNRQKFGATGVCSFDDAVDFLLSYGMKIIIDVKGNDKEVVSGVLATFASRPELYTRAAVTLFSPLQLYRLRRSDSRVVGALSYRPLLLTHGAYSADAGPALPRHSAGSVAALGARAADALYAGAWRALACWCRVSAVFLHKDIVSPSEVRYWRERDVRVIGWSVNRPLEKQYWRAVLQSSYLTSTLLGEPAQDKRAPTEEPQLQGL